VRHDQDAAVAAATVADDAPAALLADLLGQGGRVLSPARDPADLQADAQRPADGAGRSQLLDDRRGGRASRPHRLQHLLSRAVWDDQQVLDIAAAWAAGHLDDGDGLLIVDLCRSWNYAEAPAV
jgi:hypothetical protein